MEEGLENRKIKNLYNYIVNNLNSKGEINDPTLKSPLNFQYHYSAFVFSSLYFGDNKWKSVIKHFKTISANDKKISIEFNNFFFLLCKIIYKNEKIEEEFPKIKFREFTEFKYLNNNFKALDLLNRVLFDKKSKLDLEFFSNLQFDDGIFPDTNFNYKFSKNIGIPHLVYHTKILMCLGLICLFKNDKKLKQVFDKGVLALNFLNTDTINSFYGRSNNSLFGRSCTYALYSLDFIINNSINSKERADIIFNDILSLQLPDGSISLNKNTNINNRPGFDRYMYNIVYNSYSLAIFLLIDKLKNQFKCKSPIKNESKSIKGTILLKNSGFVIFKNKNVKYCFNFLGHQNFSKYLYDSRISPFSLNYLEVKGKNILPAMVMPIQPIASLVERFFFYRRIQSLYFKYRFNKYLPLLSGNTICFSYQNKIFYPFKLISKSKNKLIYEAKTRKLNNQKSLLLFSFIYKTYQNNLFQDFSFDFETNIIYSLRSKSELTCLKKNIIKLKYMSYEFNHNFIIEKKIITPTSDNIAVIYFLKFKKVKKLKVKINWDEN